MSLSSYLCGLERLSPYMFTWYDAWEALLQIEMLTLREVLVWNMDYARKAMATSQTNGHKCPAHVLLQVGTVSYAMIAMQTNKPLKDKKR